MSKSATTTFLPPASLRQATPGRRQSVRRNFPVCRVVQSDSPRRALIAGSRDTSAALCARLIAEDVRGMHIPLTRARATNASSELESAVLRLGDFDVVSFMTASAVQPFADAVLAVAGGDAAIASVAVRASGVRFASCPGDALRVKHALDVTTDLIALEEDPVALSQFVLASGPARNVLCPLPACRGMRSPRRWQAGVDAFGGCGVSVSCGEIVCAERSFVDAEIGMLLRGEIKYLIVEGLQDAAALVAVLRAGEEETLKELVDGQGSVIVVASHGCVADEVKSALGVSRVEWLRSVSFGDGVVKFIENKELELARESPALFLA